MTLQALDTVFYTGTDLSLLWHDKFHDYMRKSFPVLTLPLGGSTANRKGFLATYSIEDDRLYLNKLEFQNIAKPYPFVVGIVGKEVTEYDEFTGWVQYQPMHEGLSYTGYIVIGKSQVRHKYRDMVKQFHLCRELIKLKLVGGYVMEKTDFSAEAKTIRKQVEKSITRLFKPQTAEQLKSQRELIYRFTDKVKNISN